MITFLILFAPIPVLIVWAIIRLRIQRRKNLITQTQTPTPNEKPYEPQPEPRPNFFLRNYTLSERQWLRQQFGLARIGFYICFWIFIVMLATPLLPSEVADKYLPTLQQRAWFSFLNGATLWSTGIPVLCGIFAAILTAPMLVLGPATFYRTRPLSLRFLFWTRVLSAAAALLLAATVSIALSFAALRIAYGPAWNSVPHTATSVGMRHALLDVDDDETPAQAVERRLNWLSGSSPARIFTSAVTSMMLTFATFVLISCQPFANGKSSPQSMPKWVVFGGGMAGVIGFNFLKSSNPFSFGRFLFWSAPWQPSPPWSFLPIPIVLIVVLLFLSEHFYLHRDV